MTSRGSSAHAAKLPPFTTKLAVAGLGRSSGSFGRVVEMLLLSVFDEFNERLAEGIYDKVRETT